MAVAFVMEFAALERAKYDAVMKEMGLDRPDVNWPNGLVSHLAGKTADGWCVVDVWESPQAFDAFRQSMLGPAFERVGGLPQPRVTQVDIYHRGPAPRYPSA